MKWWLTLAGVWLGIVLVVVVSVAAVSAWVVAIPVIATFFIGMVAGWAAIFPAVAVADRVDPF